MRGLFNLANEHEDCRKTAYEHIRQRFSTKLIIFYNFAYNGDYDFNEEYGNSIQIRNPKNIIQALEVAGSSIRRLQIGSVSYNKQISEIINLIFEHCSKTLVHLYLFEVEQNIFKNVIATFDKVKIVSLVRSVDGLGNEKFDFRDLFPAVHELELIQFDYYDASNLTIEIPQLDKLYISHRNPLSNQTESVIEEIFKKNPQIQSLIYDNIQPKMLKAVADHLPTLGKLEMLNYHKNRNDEYSYHFEHLKVFKIENKLDASWPSHLTIGDQLEEFEVYFYQRSEHIIRFIEEHKNLKKLRNHGNNFSNDDILRLAAANLSVTEMRLQCDYGVEDETIVHAIKNFKQLQKLHLLRFTSDEGKLKIFIRKLHEHFANEWNIENEKENFYLEKKN